MSSSSRAGASAALSKPPARTPYDDVFGGPPKFAAPFKSKIDDYAEILGGLGASCSIPFLNLSPTTDACADVAGRVDYAEVFGGLDFGAFGVPYEELVAEKTRTKGESTFGQQAKKASSILQPSNVFSLGSPQNIKLASHAGGLGCNERTSGTTHVAELHAVSEYNDVANDARPPFRSNEIENPCFFVQVGRSETIHSDMSSSTSSVSSRGSETNLKKSRKQNNLNSTVLEKDNASIDHLSRSSSSHSLSSTGASETKFVSVADISLRTRSLKVPPPSRPPPKVSNKLGNSTPNTSSFINDAINIAIPKPVSGEEYVSKVSSGSQPYKKVVKEIPTSFFDAEADVTYDTATSAVVAMKEAMEQAEARLRIAKDSMERNRDYIRKSKIIGNDDKKQKETKINKSPSLSEQTIIIEDKQTDKLISKETTEVTNAAREMLTQMNILEEGKVIDASLYNDGAKISVALLVNHASVETESYVEQANQVPVVAPAISIETCQPCSNVEEEYGNQKMNQENSELTNSQRIRKNVDVVFEHKAVMKKTESTMKFSDDDDDDKNVNIIEAALSSELESYSNFKDEDKKSDVEENIARQNEMDKNVARQDEMEKNVARPDIPPEKEELKVVGQDIVHDKEEIKGTHNMNQEDCGHEENINDLGPAVISHEDKNENLKKDESLLGAENLQCVNDQASTSGSEKSPDSSGTCEFQLVHNTKEKEWISEAAAVACEIETNFNGSNEINDHGEERTIPDRLKDNVIEENDNRCFMADDTTCEPCNYGEKLTVPDTSDMHDGNVSKLDEKENVIEENDNRCFMADDTTCEPCNYGEKLTVPDTSDMHDGNESKLDETASGCKPYEPTYRDENAKSNCAENEYDNKESWQEKERAILNKTPFPLEENEIILEVKQETEWRVDESENKSQRVAQQLEEVKPNVESTSSLEDDFTEGKVEKSKEELQKNYKNDDSDKMASSVGNSEEKKIEFCNLDTTAKVAAPLVVNQRSMIGQFDTQKASWYERQGSVITSVVDIKENCFSIPEKIGEEMKNMEIKQNKRRMENERELTEGEARKFEENKPCKKDMEMEMEMEREREKEREKDRIAVERATSDANERIAVERVTAEFRQRALKEAREKAALDVLLAEKVKREARLRADRAAVDRVTIEVRQRAAEKAAMDAKECTEKYTAASKDRMWKESMTNDHVKAGTKDGPCVQFRNGSSSSISQGNNESALRYKATLERKQRTSDRAAKALADMKMRDIIAQREQAEKNRIADHLDANVKRWSNGKEGNLRALLSTLQYILGPESGWQPIPLTDVVTSAAVKKAYRKATLVVHPDKLQQRGASIQQKYICEKVFDLLKEAWNKHNSEER